MISTRDGALIMVGAIGGYWIGTTLERRRIARQLRDTRVLSVQDVRGALSHDQRSAIADLLESGREVVQARVNNMLFLWLAGTNGQLEQLFAVPVDDGSPPELEG